MTAVPATDALLVLNAGSSSLKFSVYAGAQPLVRGQLDGLSGAPRFVVRSADGVVADRRWPEGSSLEPRAALEHLFAWGHDGGLGAHRLVAVGHRVVHGGTHFDRPVRIDARVLAELRSLIALAPLHQPHNLAAIDAILQLAPELPQVACFDTSFHRTQPVVAQAFGLPRRYTDEGVRRYGFHGLSYEHIADVLPGFDGRAARGRTVVAHLGNGASLCALSSGQSVATTMGFTALDGLLMGTRAGALDPGVLLYLLERHALGVQGLERLLYQESGLLGVSGISADVRVLLASEHPHAREALDLFVYRVGRELGSLAAALGGLDGLVFTGGIGENAAAIRARVCRDASWLGLQLDEAANQAGGPRLSREGSAVSAWAIPTDEEGMIARHTRRLLGHDPHGQDDPASSARAQGPLV